ncbi:MAG: HesA/MoeB/ThiF family protein [Kiritimatiellae bacterium]|nr:HesA/MoeB/ThiF family protein [Kiritimatiellia bacterium]
MNKLHGEQLSLNVQERERYARHLSLPGIGADGQKKLAESRVLIVGAGGLGSPAALYLAAAGVFTIGLMDADTVEPSNLQRQILHFTDDIGRLKTESAAEKLHALNSDVRVRTYPFRLTGKNARSILGNFDFVIDATDNFPSKIMIANACHAAKKPYSHAGVAQYSGQTMTVLPGQTACYRCVFDSPPKDPRKPQGPLGAVPGVIGAIQAAEAIKYLLDIGDLLTNRLLTFDALKMKFREVPLKRNPCCKLCASRR